MFLRQLAGEPPGRPRGCKNTSLNRLVCDQLAGGVSELGCGAAWVMRAPPLRPTTLSPPPFCCLLVLLCKHRTCTAHALSLSGARAPRIAARLRPQLSGHRLSPRADDTQGGAASHPPPLLAPPHPPRRLLRCPCRNRTHAHAASAAPPTLVQARAGVGVGGGGARRGAALLSGWSAKRQESSASSPLKGDTFYVTNHSFEPPRHAPAPAACRCKKVATFRALSFAPTRVSSSLRPARSSARPKRSSASSRTRARSKGTPTYCSL